MLLLPAIPLFFNWFLKILFNRQLQNNGEHYFFFKTKIFFKSKQYRKAALNNDSLILAQDYSGRIVRNTRDLTGLRIAPSEVVLWTHGWMARSPLLSPPTKAYVWFHSHSSICRNHAIHWAAWQIKALRCNSYWMPCHIKLSSTYLFFFFPIPETQPKQN